MKPGILAENTTHHSTDYPEQFFIDGNMMTDHMGLIYYKPQEIEIKSYHRLRGNAVPEDNCILYQIETADGRRGTLTYKYDVFTDSKVFNFLKEYVDFKNSTWEKNNSTNYAYNSVS